MTTLFPDTNDIFAARERLSAIVSATPLIRFNEDGSNLHLKLETLHPVRSFKLRGAANAMLAAPAAQLREGVFTPSAGNFGQSVAWMGRRLGVPVTAIVPEGASEAKLVAMRALGAAVEQVSQGEWWRIMCGESPRQDAGLLLHPVLSREVIAGAATIGLEIAEQLPDAVLVIAPFGGGGLSCGIALGLAAAGSRAAVRASEVDTAAPLTPSLDAGRPVEVEKRQSFVDGIGAPSLLPGMWPTVSHLLAGADALSPAEIAEAVRILFSEHAVVTEGAGASALAAGLRQTSEGPVVCVISGGVISPDVYARILAGEVPG